MMLSTAGFGALKSDEVFVEGMLASDVASLWRRLARTGAVRDVARSLSCERARIEALCRFVQALLDQPHEQGFRHPNDIAICAGLVVLQDSPLTIVRKVFAKLRRSKRSSLVWVQRMAEYCDERCVATIRGASAGRADDERIPSLVLPASFTAGQATVSFAPAPGCAQINLARNRQEEACVA